MKLKFRTNLMNDDWKLSTHTVNGSKGIVVYDENDMYSYEEMIEIVKSAHKIERWRNGWDIQFTKDGQNKCVFASGRGETVPRQTIFQWLYYLFDTEIKLF